MKTVKMIESLNAALASENLNEFVLSNEEMTCIRGGDAEGNGKPCVPPVLI
jgi:hypothetical protein